MLANLVALFHELSPNSQKSIKTGQGTWRNQCNIPKESNSTHFRSCSFNGKQKPQDTERYPSITVRAECQQDLESPRNKPPGTLWEIILKQPLGKSWGIVLIRLTEVGRPTLKVVEPFPGVGPRFQKKEEAEHKYSLSSASRLWMQQDQMPQAPATMNFPTMNQNKSPFP